jgi:N-acetylneuraminic acid mutarotase
MEEGRGGLEGYDAERYNIKTDRWVRLLNMIRWRINAAVVGLNRRIYVLGGILDADNVAMVDKYNPESKKWSRSRSMSEKKSNVKAAAWRGKVFVTGGEDEEDVLDSCEAYDPSTMRWTKVGSMLTARSDHGLATVGDMLVALGGMVSDGTTAAVEAYDDEEADVWRPLCPMPTPRSAFGCCAVPLAALEPKLREQLHSQTSPAEP